MYSLWQTWGKAAVNQRVLLLCGNISYLIIATQNHPLDTHALNNSNAPDVAFPIESFARFERARREQDEGFGRGALSTVATVSGAVVGSFHVVNFLYELFIRNYAPAFFARDSHIFLKLRKNLLLLFWVTKFIGNFVNNPCPYH